MPLDVLVVDDSAAIRKILQRVLAQTELPLGTILEAADGIEAIERLKNHKIGLVLADINMPNMDGIELLTKMREMVAMVEDNPGHRWHELLGELTHNAFKPAF